MLASIRMAVDDVAAGRASAVVTNPIAKSVLYRAGFRHPGHTEFLAELAEADGRVPQPVMMLWSPRLAVVPLTIHVSDTYFIVAHIHYVLFGGSLFTIYAGVYYWFPKMTGRMFD